MSSLREAFEKVARNKRSKGGVDEISVATFAEDGESHLRRIGLELRRGSYSFSRLRPVAIEKKGGAGYRPILVPTVSDRIVQRAILHQLSNYLVPYVSHRNSHAFRADAGVRSAVRQLRDEIQARKRVILVVDIVDFFSSISSDQLFEELRSVLPDSTLDPLLRQLQRWEIDDLSRIPAYKQNCFPQAGKGVPQGSALSPILSNFFLRDLDRDGAAKDLSVIRYADDIAIACESPDEAIAAYDWLQGHMDKLGLSIHALGEKKSHIITIGSRHKGIEYLGCFISIVGNRIAIRPSRSSIDHALETIAKCFDPESKASLSQRYAEISYFLNAWLGTFGYVCGSIKRDREKLLHSAEKGLHQLLVAEGLLPSDSDLTKEQRRFLGVDAIFTRASKTKGRHLGSTLRSSH